MADDDDDPGIFAERDATDAFERMEFLELVGRGTLPELAAIEIGWTPAKLRRYRKDKGFSDLIDEAARLTDTRVEQVIVAKALLGVEWAVKLYAFNRMPDRWRDMKNVQIQHSIEVPAHVLEATREATREAVREAVLAGQIGTVQRQLIEAREVRELNEG